MVQAAAIGESGRVYVLDMGEPVKIVDLARDMIRLAGHGPDEIAITYTGLRPGEKLYEELLADDEHSLPTPHPKLRVARAQPSANAALLAEVVAWIGAAQDPGAEAVCEQLRSWVPEYTPAAGGAAQTVTPGTVAGAGSPGQAGR